MATSEILTALGLMGIGSSVTAIVNYYVNVQKSKQDSKHTLKELRYKAIILMCFAYINYEKEKVNLIINRPDINSIDSLYDELCAEWINMALYASDKVVLKMKGFLIAKNSTAFHEVILAMRKDLYKIRTRLTVENFDF